MRLCEPVGDFPVLCAVFLSPSHNAHGVAAENFVRGLPVNAAGVVLEVAVGVQVGVKKKRDERGEARANIYTDP